MGSFQVECVIENVAERGRSVALIGCEIDHQTATSS
jgi:hypothetical protein